MRKLAALVIASLLTASCSNNRPTDQTERQYPVSTVDSTKADVALVPDDMRWFDLDNGDLALFGPTVDEPVIELRCIHSSGGASQLRFSWNVEATQDAVGTIEVGWGRNSETFYVSSIENPGMQSGYAWFAQFPPSGAKANLLLSSTGPITLEMQVGEDHRITLPPNDAMNEVIQNCQDNS